MHRSSHHDYRGHVSQGLDSKVYDMRTSCDQIRFAPQTRGWMLQDASQVPRVQGVMDPSRFGFQVFHSGYHRSQVSVRLRRLVANKTVKRIDQVVRADKLPQSYWVRLLV